MYQIKMIFFLFFSLALGGCLPTSSSNRINQRLVEESLSLSHVTFSTKQSFIEDRGTHFYQTFFLINRPSFIHPIKLKGENIHKFLLLEQNRLKEACLLVRFPEGTQNKLLLLPLISRREVNIEKRTFEYYYLIQNSSQSLGCSSKEFKTQLQKNFPSKNTTFLLNDICPNCSKGIRSEGLQIYINESGNDISKLLKISQIVFQFSNISSSYSQPSHKAPSCLSDGQCQSLKSEYDCCLQRQCVKDQGIRPHVNLSSPSFLQSVESIAQKPKSYH